MRKNKRTRKNNRTRKTHGGVGTSPTSKKTSKNSSPLSENNMCPVCLENVSDNDKLQLSCHKKHFVCKTCAPKLINADHNKCPTCRKPVKQLNIIPNEILIIVDRDFNDNDFPGLVTENNKIQLVEKLSEIYSSEWKTESILRYLKFYWSGNSSFLSKQKVLYNTLYTGKGTPKKKIGKNTLEPIKNALKFLLSIKYMFNTYGITEFPIDSIDLLDKAKNILTDRGVSLPTDEEITRRAELILHFNR